MEVEIETKCGNLLWKPHGGDHNQGFKRKIVCILQKDRGSGSDRLFSDIWRFDDLTIMWLSNIARSAMLDGTKEQILQTPKWQLYHMFSLRMENIITFPWSLSPSKLKIFNFNVLPYARQHCMWCTFGWMFIDARTTSSFYGHVASNWVGGWLLKIQKSVHLFMVVANNS